MPILKNVLGLDLGSHALKAAEFRQTLRGIEVAQLRALPVSNGEASLPERLQDFAQTHRLATDHVVCALAGESISLRRLQFPFRDRKKLAQAIPFEVEGTVPFDLDDLVVAWEIVGGDRSRTDVVAAIARRSIVSSTLETLRAAGCEPRTLEAEGLALGNLGALFDLTGTRLVVDLGHSKTSLCLMADGQALAARTIPIGGLAITRGIARDKGASEADAELAKCEDGIFARGLTPAFPHAVAALDRIARELVRTLGAFEPLLGGPPARQIEEITLVGGTARLHRVDEYLTERTGVATARLALPTDPVGASLVAAGDPLLFASAIALGLRGTARATTRVDFRRDEFAFRHSFREVARDFRWTAVLASVTLVLFALGVGVSRYLDARRVRGYEERIAQLYAEAFPGRSAPTSPLRAMREDLRSAHERAQFLGVYGGKLSALDLLTEISARVPRELDVVFEELSIDGQVIRMRVYSKSFEAADRLSSELARFAPFAHTRVTGEIQTDAKRGGKTFTVTISLSPEGRNA